MSATNPFGSAPVIAVGADPRTEPGLDINAGSFWPVINMANARAAMRIDGSVTEARLRAALIEAAITVCESLAAWKIAQLAAGANSLNDIGERIDGASRNTHRWLRAVHCLAAANLAERYRGSDATAEGANRAEIIEAPIEDLRRDASWAIADIQGRTRTVVELI